MTHTPEPTAEAVERANVRASFCDGCSDQFGAPWAESEARFDAWLAAHDAQVAEKALREAADDIEPITTLQGPAVAEVLRARAASAARAAEAVDRG